MKGASTLPALVPMGLNLHLRDDQGGASAGERLAGRHVWKRMALESPGNHTSISIPLERLLNGLLKATALLGALRSLFRRCGSSWV